MASMRKWGSLLVLAAITILALSSTVSSQTQCADVRLTASTYINYFSSSNYPGQYPSNMDCKWLFKADYPSNVVVLDIFAFSLDESLICDSDYVKIYDGPSTSSSLIATLCGRYYFGTYKSTGSDLTVVFHSDGVISDTTGFRFSYKSQQTAPDISGTIDFRPSSSTSSTTASSRIYLLTAVPISVIVLGLISALCCRRRVVRGQFRATQMVRSAQMVTTARPARPATPPMPAPNENASQANLFFVPIESNNQAEAPTDTTRPNATSGTPHNSQASSDPPRYSNLNCDINASLPAYDPRGADYRAMNLRPAYSQLAGGAAPYRQMPLPYDPKPDKSSLGLGSFSDEAGYANMGFSSDA